MELLSHSPISYPIIFLKIQSPDLSDVVYRPQRNGPRRTFQDLNRLLPSIHIKVIITQYKIRIRRINLHISCIGICINSDFVPIDLTSKSKTSLYPSEDRFGKRITCAVLKTFTISQQYLKKKPECHRKTINKQPQSTLQRHGLGFFIILSFYSSYPLGLLLCHLQASSHISLMPYCASQPSSSFALAASA